MRRYMAARKQKIALCDKQLVAAAGCQMSKFMRSARGFTAHHVLFWDFRLRFQSNASHRSCAAPAISCEKSAKASTAGFIDTIVCLTGQPPAAMFLCDVLHFVWQ